MLTDFQHTPLPSSYLSFYDAWQDARVDGALPLRADIRLQEFATFAGSMHIYELKTPTELHCRLMGSEITDRLSGFAPGENVFEFLSGEHKPLILKWWNAMAIQPCGGLTQFPIGYKSGANRMVETLVLPIMGKRNNVLFLIYNEKPKLMAAGEPRDRVKLAHSDSKGKYIDVGFGVPSSNRGKSNNTEA